MNPIMRISLSIVIAACSATIYAAESQITINNTVITVQIGDLLNLPDATCIVNAANEQLSHGGGVAATIDKASKGMLQKGSNDYIAKHKELPTGNAWLQDITIGNTITSVVHTVGPTGTNPHKEYYLANAYQNALAAADKRGVSSIAFPPISIGIFGYDYKQAIPIAIEQITDYVKKNPNTGIKRIIFVIYDKDSEQQNHFQSATQRLEACNNNKLCGKTYEAPKKNPSSQQLSLHPAIKYLLIPAITVTIVSAAAYAFYRLITRKSRAASPQSVQTKKPLKSALKPLHAPNTNKPKKKVTFSPDVA